MSVLYRPPIAKRLEVDGGRSVVPRLNGNRDGPPRG